MFFVSSILISHDAMYWVARMFEGEPLFGKAYPILVTLVAVGIFTLLLVHALLVLRKFPSNVQQYQAIHQHSLLFKHGDIGPYASSDRVWSGRMWPLYLILLFVVEIHGGVGLYRLAMKWGWFLGKDVKKSRRRLQVAKWLITVFFLILGCATLQAYMKIGYDHQSLVGERYLPDPVQSQSQQKSQNLSQNPGSN